MNWFRKVSAENFSGRVSAITCVLEWIIDRCEETGGAVIADWLAAQPTRSRSCRMDVEHKCIVEILGIDHEEWQKELAAHAKFFDSLGGSCG